MKATAKLSALILALLMLFTACETGKTNETEAPTTAVTESTTAAATEPITEESATETPTAIPTEAPTTEAPTEAPTEEPTEAPTTEAPTAAPTEAPTTEAPTEAPTEEPTTEAPTEAPTEESATEEPAEEPTTETPTEEPTEAETTYRDSISKSREEVEAMLTITDDAYTNASALLENFKKLSIEGKDIKKIEEASVAFEEAFYYIATQLQISSIIYNIDMSDETAYDTYMGIYENYGELYDSYIETTKYIYENSPMKDLIFAGWTDEDIASLFGYSPEITELQLKNEDLTNRINNLGNEEFWDKAAELYAEIVTNNNKIAKLQGYDNYYDYASEKIYGRDYGRADLESFCNNISKYVIPRYDALMNDVNTKLDALGNADMMFLYCYLYEPFDTLDKNYIEGYISSLSGSMKEGMEHIFVNRNMIFSDSENSHPSAFQVYLDALNTPFCLFGFEGQTTDTIIHEIGHYYASLYSDVTSYDLAEIQSQANELLLLNYLKDQTTPAAYDALKTYAMAMDISEIIISVIIDEFEREVYALESVEGYGSEEFDAIMTKVCEKYGGRDYIDYNIVDTCYYWRMVATNNPVYYISYAVSNSAALNIFSMASEDRAAGREAYRIIIEDLAIDDTFLSALKKAGIESPFTSKGAEQLIFAIYGEKITVESNDSSDIGGDSSENPEQGGDAGENGDKPEQDGNAGENGGNPGQDGDAGENGGNPGQGGNAGENGDKPEQGGDAGENGDKPEQGGDAGENGGNLEETPKAA